MDEAKLGDDSNTTKKPPQTAKLLQTGTGNPQILPLAKNSEKVWGWGARGVPGTRDLESYEAQPSYRLDHGLGHHLNQAFECFFYLPKNCFVTSVKDNALGMDGPVFYSAREAIRNASNRPGHAIVFKSSIMDDIDVIKVDAMFQSLSVIRKLWTDKFIKVLPLLRKGYTQKEIALKIGIKQPSVSKLLNNACWGEVLELQEKTSAILEKSFQKYVNQQTVIPE